METNCSLDKSEFSLCSKVELSWLSRFVIKCVLVLSNVGLEQLRCAIPLIMPSWYATISWCAC